jgi:hypothetical protein
MKRSVWPAGLVLVVQLAWAATAAAQAPAARSTPIASTGVTLGRPIASAPGTPRLFPNLPDVQTVSYAGSGNATPIATTPGSDGTPRPWPSEVYDPSANSEFAIDRPVPPRRTTVIIPTSSRVAAEDVLPTPRAFDPNRPIASNVLPDPRTVPGPTAGAAGAGAGAAAGQWAPADAPCPTEVMPRELQPWYDPNRSACYASAEYLLWWINGYHVPPLATTSNTADAGIISPGNSTRVIFGDDTFNRGSLSGMRLTAGYWFNCEEGIEVSAFFLGRDTESTLLRGTQFPVLARPFTDVNRNIPFSQITNFPNLFCGDLSILSPFSLWGTEVNLRCNLCCWHSCECELERSYRVDMLVGFRYLDMDERLTLQEDIIGDAAAPSGANDRITVVDTFGTRNQFYGGQVGLDAEYHWGRWSLNARSKLALGDTHERIQIDGSQRLVSLIDGSVQNFRGGLLALDGANIGVFTKDRFSVVPELTLTVGYQLYDHVRIFGGYNVLYWSNVIRPGDQIDTRLDVSKIPNFNTGNPADAVPAPGHPSVPFKTSDFWAQGITVGFEIRY